MSQFTSKHSQGKYLSDGVFGVAKEARERKAEIGNDEVIDSTLGVFFTENEELGTLATFFEKYNELDSLKKAKYSEAIIGNKKYLDAVENWVLDDVKRDFYVRSVATAGGTGALSNTMWNHLDAGQAIVFPSIAWGSYKVMAKEYSLEMLEYELFDENDTFNIKSFLDNCREAVDKHGKVVAIINDPCHNPTGYTMSDVEWKEVIEGLNNISEKGPVILINDIAYMDFSFKGLKESRQYMNTFNNISDNVMVIIAFSMSKSFTSYGFRVGAQIALAKKEETVEEFKKITEFSCRSRWSNIPNGGMEIFSDIMGDADLLKKSNEERAEFVDMLAARGNIFRSEARECGLPIYPYKEGFFVTVRLSKEDTLDLQEALKKKNIFTVAVGGGIRIALCGLTQKKVKGLAFTIKETLDELKKG
ncbi:aminotransferase class I/II-fold pyridoxal phosphate-dependent enzyme [uncultured Ilyobacter sp.]|uniref:pyridoxal phosphate-dependent aminotransferase n=1 Tax=uncultured Ilyobacter sp. TaxID=544433 RepID=UPI0029F555C5|nr:aminotransferase class I/II-fold pyridoxal phosphate-dependent enzyme [uncultured Ilyobacter sp.]